MIVLVVTIVPIGFRPTTGLPPNVERFCVMAAVGALFAAAYPKRFWLIVLALTLAAVLFEPLQYIAAGRHPAFRDVEFKSLGATIGAIIGYATAFTVGQFNSRLLPPAS
jgi:VanZ family protein